MRDRVTIIAEGEINHNGDVGLAKRMVESAHACGADVIKFQCYVTESFVAPGSRFFPIFKSAELGADDFRAIRDCADEVGIRFISTAGDVDGLRMIVDLDLPIIKIGSTNITNVSLLRAVAEVGRSVYLSTGAADIGEIERAVEILSRGTDDITLFHCTVLYPAPDHLLNLRAIPTMAAAFPGIPVGYSDHTRGSIAAVTAVALGVTAVEKHFTLDNNLPGPDHGFSTNPEDFAEYVQAVRAAERMLGSAEKRPVCEEENVRIAGRRYLTAFRDIPLGAAITAAAIRPRRVDTSGIDPTGLMDPQFEDLVVGWRARRAIPAGKPLTWADLEPRDRPGEGAR